MRQRGPVDGLVYLLMSRAYKGGEMWALVVELGYRLAAPPRRNHKNPWNYEEQLYGQCSQIKSLFRRTERFCRIFTRYNKLDAVFLTFVCFALIVDALM